MNEKNSPQNSRDAWQSLIAERAREARFQVSDVWDDHVVLRIAGEHGGSYHFSLTLEEAGKLEWLLRCAVMAAEFFAPENGGES